MRARPTSTCAWTWPGSATSGVRLLAELAARQAAGGGDVTVRAPAGGPVHRVLVLTGLEDAMALKVEET